MKPVIPLLLNCSRYIYVLLLLMIVAQAAQAQHPGTPDLSFGIKGVVPDTSTVQDYSFVTALSDGKLLISGNGLYNGFHTIVVKRLSADGALDTTYGNKGSAYALFPGYTSPEQYGVSLGAVALLPNNQLLALGTYIKYGSYEKAVALIRFLPNGTIDATFGNGGTTIYRPSFGFPTIHAAVIQSNGNIVAGGEVLTDVNNRFVHPYLAGFTGKGKFNESFGNKGEVVDNDQGIYASLALQAQDKIVAGGENWESLHAYKLDRYTADGNIDPSFNSSAPLPPFVSFYSINDLAVQEDGKLIGVCTAGLQNYQNIQSVLVKVNNNGTLDNGFAGKGYVPVFKDSGSVKGVLLTGVNHDKIVAYGSILTPNRTQQVALAAFNDDGTADSSFGNNGQQFSAFTNYSTAKYADVQPDGKIVVLGYTIHSKNLLPDKYGVARYHGYSPFPEKLIVFAGNKKP